MTNKPPSRVVGGLAVEDVEEAEDAVQIRLLPNPLQPLRRRVVLTRVSIPLRQRMNRWLHAHQRLRQKNQLTGHRHPKATICRQRHSARLASRHLDLPENQSRPLLRLNLQSRQTALLADRRLQQNANQKQPNPPQPVPDLVPGLPAIQPVLVIHPVPDRLENQVRPTKKAIANPVANVAAVEDEAEVADGAGAGTKIAGAKNDPPMIVVLISQVPLQHRIPSLPKNSTICSQDSVAAVSLPSQVRRKNPTHLLAQAGLPKKPLRLSPPNHESPAAEAVATVKVGTTKILAVAGQDVAAANVRNADDVAVGPGDEVHEIQNQDRRNQDHLTQNDQKKALALRAKNVERNVASRLVAARHAMILAPSRMDQDAASRGRAGRKPSKIRRALKGSNRRDSTNHKS